MITQSLVEALAVLNLFVHMRTSISLTLPSLHEEELHTGALTDE